MGNVSYREGKERLIFMNIKSAKTEIKRTLKLYLEKDEKGHYLMPQVKQRPLFLIGPPGVGKTAIMEQIAAEEKVALVSYTITHHTRQSAVGLPFIKEKEYSGKKYSVTEYTMSEIIAEIYETMERTGIKEGILFLDEINCVSETLAPMMLQFLQEKKFGNFSIPEGWVIVTAGNPQGYNKSVREFDSVTLDRIRVINIEAEYGVWRNYALEKGVHGAILGFLEIKKENFYHVENTVDGVKIVTARGWEDLSVLLDGYERNGYDILPETVAEFIKDKRIAVDFTNFLELYRKYENKYKINEILESGEVKENGEHYRSAGFDEKISVVSMLLSGLNNYFIKSYTGEEYLKRLFEVLKRIKDGGCSKKIFNKEMTEILNEYERLRFNKLLDKTDEKIYERLIFKLNELNKYIGDYEKFSLRCSKIFKDEKEEVLNTVRNADRALSNSVSFMETYIKEDDEDGGLSTYKGSEIVYFISELETNYYSMSFLREHGNEAVERYGKLLKTGSLRNELMEEIGEIE